MPFPLLLALAGLFAAGGPATLPAAPVCQDPGMRRVETGTPRVDVHPLDREPAGKQMLAVMRSVDGCIRPVVVREEVGRPPAPLPGRMRP